MLKTMETFPILQGRALHTYYGSSHVLRGASLSIGRGETVGLMGRNGMGKTTLLRTLVDEHRGQPAGAAALRALPASRSPASPMCRKGAASLAR